METPASLTHIGKYEILAELGRGGMGVVYRAEDKNIGREVAIKTLTDTTPELRQRFLVEARSGVLNHQNIVTVYDFGEQDGSPYIVMEYLHGESLEKVLRGSTLSLVDKLEIVRQVCEGLSYAHSKGVVHRDIKPANIMVQPGGHIKIVDFGIARLESSSGGQTQTGAVIGTFHYISPERLKGHPSDGRADIWAAGIMLYQMVTGVLPFPGEDISALHKVVNEPFPPLKNYLPNYPPALDDVLNNALAKDPEDRYASAEEMASDLEAITEVLKRARVGETLVQIKGLLDEDKLTQARPMLLDLQRLDPQNSEIRKMLREVQDRLARQQKSEQVRQTLNMAEEAVLSQRYSEALELYKQAGRIDPNTTGLQEKIQHVQGLKEKVERITALQNQAREARERRDLTAASQLIDEALRLDERNTNLRNERAGILREIERQAKDSTRRKLKESGRNLLAQRSYTAAIKDLREALDIDPTDAEVQKFFQEATARQEEDRRRKVIEQIVAEIQDSLFRNDTERALQLINRALDRLPAEAALLRLKADTEQKLQEEHAQKLVQATSLRVQELFFSNPQEALSVVQQALTEIPGEEHLLALQERVVDQLKKANLEGLRAQYIKHAQTSLAARQYDQAISSLESAVLDCGESPELRYLLENARAEKRKSEQAQASAAVLEQANKRLAEEDLEGAVGILKAAMQSGVGGPAIEQLLRQTQERLDEVSRRLDAVIARVTSLAETDPAQALQVMAAQPASVQQHSALRALRAKLDIAAEQQKATQQAVAQAAELRGKRDLRGGMEALEAVRRAYGDSPAITAAIADYKQRQTSVASEMVSESIVKARQALLAKKGGQALEELQRSAEVLELAEPNLRADWNRLAQEAAQAAKVKVGTGNVPIIVQAKGPSTGMIAGIAAAVLVVVGAVLFLTLHGRPSGGAAVTPTSYLQLNASPYAEVESVTGGDGKPVTLPAGSHMTPLRLDGLADGNYTVVFKASDGSEQKQTCPASGEQPCTAPTSAIGDTQIDEILAGGK